MHSTDHDTLEIRKISGESKNKFMNLLLEADEQQDMVMRYLYRGQMFVLYSGDTAVSVCMVTDEGGGVCEIKNLATYAEHRGKGYARYLVACVASEFTDNYDKMIVGTGEVPRMLRFYQACGFTVSHRVEDFFTDNYDHPIVEDGVVLKDMVYLEMCLG